MEKLEGNGLRALTADADDSVNPQLAGVANNFAGDVANDFLAIFDGAILERIAAVGRPQDGPAAGQNPGDRTAIEFNKLVFDQALPAISKAQNFNLIVISAPDDGANRSIQSGTITAAG